MLEVSKKFQSQLSLNNKINEPLVKINSFSSYKGVPIYIDTPLLRKAPSQEEQSIINNEIDFLNGNNKRKLVEWYLEYIETNIDRFLISDAAFNFSVIPTMYLDTPPSSMSEIERNLVIVRRFLDDLEFNQRQQPNNNNDINSNINQDKEPKHLKTKIYKELVVPVRSTVQNSINKSKAEFEVIIWNCLSAFGLRHRSTFDSSSSFYIEAKQRLDDPRNGDKIKNRNKLSEIINDLQHLELMEQYDDNFFVMNHSATSADDPVVGVIGLILNRLHRLENELKTIHHHWSPNKLNVRSGVVNTPSFQQNF